MNAEISEKISASVNTLASVRTLAVNKVMEKNTITQKNLAAGGALALNFLAKKLEKIADDAKSEKSADDLQAQLKKAEDKVASLQQQIAAITGEGDTSELDKITEFVDGLPTESANFSKETIDSVNKFAQAKGWKYVI